MPTLYQLDADLKALSALLAESEGEADDETLARYDALLDARDDKADAYLSVIRNHQTEADAIQSEIDRLTVLRDRASRVVDRLTSRLHDSMLANGDDELAGRLGRIRLYRRSSSRVLPLVDAAELPERFQRLRIEPDKTALKAALESHDEEAVRYAEIETRETTHIRIL